MARRNAIVEPLPLVPATWMTGGNFRCGSFRRDSSARVRVSGSPGSGATGTSGQYGISMV